jgi:predicted nucleic acid-binding protein
LTHVIDASVASKWVLPEPDSDKATELRSADPDLIAPSLVAAEIGNALWKAHRRGDTATVDTGDMLKVAVAHFTRLVPTEELAHAALRFAIDLRHPIYDCFYLALAEREAATLVTADARLLAVAKKAKVKVRQL